MKTKTTLSYLLSAWLWLAAMPAFTQVIDLSTGIDALNNPIGLLAYDDDWMVSYGGSGTTLPPSSSYVPVKCGSGIPDGWGVPYTGKSPLVKWLSPYLNTLGESTTLAGAGYYYYRLTFDLHTCDIQSAVMQFDHIGGDDVIDQIIVNGNVHTLSPGYDFNPPWGAGTSLTVTGDILPMTVNEIVVRVYNYSVWTGMEIKGKLNITGTPATSPSFFLSLNGNLLQGTGFGSSSDIWTVYESPNGSTGTYNYVGTYTGANLSIPAGQRCYYVTHQVDNQCGPTCAAQTICNISCGNPNQCYLPSPQHLTYDYSTHKLSWDPVPGAVSYIIQVTPNDPACCVHGDPPPFKSGPTFNIPVTTYSHTLDYYTDLGMDVDFLCFSWRVIPVCEGGTNGPPSATFCADGDHHGFRETGVAPSAAAIPTALDIFPNPPKGTVNFDIATTTDAELTLRITDLTGKTVKVFDKVKTTNKKAAIRWNTESLNKGVYLVNVETSDHQAISKKLVIE